MKRKRINYISYLYTTGRSYDTIGKRIKYVANIDFGYRSITDAKQYIKIFLKSLLSQIGLQLGIDYIVTANHLRIRHVKNITGKITTTLKEIFPVFNFYWKTPRLLVWF